MLTDIVDDQMDVVGRAFLGLTIACARCHDHKFDPIPQADYYALAGIFFSSHILPGPGAKTGGLAGAAHPAGRPVGGRGAPAAPRAAKRLNEQIDRTISEQYAGAGEGRAAPVGRVPVGGLGLRPPARRTRPQTPAQLAARAEAGCVTPSPAGRHFWRTARRQSSSLAEPCAMSAAIKGFSGWRNPGPSGTPAASANATDQPTCRHDVDRSRRTPSRSTRRRRARSPSAGGAPISGTVAVRGGLSDADPNCGDGIDWRVIDPDAHGCSTTAGRVDPQRRPAIVRRSRRRRSNGSAASRSGDGDIVEVTRRAEGRYSCDTTVVDLHISETDGERREWDLSREVSPSVLADGKSNPHADSFGHPGVWSFYETPIAPSPPPPRRVRRWPAGWIWLAGPRPTGSRSRPRRRRSPARSTR